MIASVSFVTSTVTDVLCIEKWRFLMRVMQIDKTSDRVLTLPKIPQQAPNTVHIHFARPPSKTQAFTALPLSFSLVPGTLSFSFSLACPCCLRLLTGVYTSLKFMTTPKNRMSTSGW